MIDAAQQTLETMFFAIADNVSDDTTRPAGELIAASLAFRGSPDGQFGLLASEPLARALAANFFGCEEGSAMALGHVTGVIAELTNMICGAALTRIESEAAFDLDAPKTVRISPDESVPAFSAVRSVCRLDFPEGSLVLFLSFEDRA